MSIDHAAAAVSVMEAANGKPVELATTIIAQAQVHATLAVAAVAAHGKQHGAIRTPVEPSKHYCSDRALLDMIESPQIPEADKPPMRVELAVRLMERVAP